MTAPSNPMEAFEKALTEYAKKQGAFDAADFPSARAFDRGAKIVGKARAAVVEAYREALRNADRVKQEAFEAVPSTWLDPILTGRNAVVGKPPYGCPEIEDLFRAISARIVAINAATAPHTEASDD